MKKMILTIAASLISLVSLNAQGYVDQDGLMEVVEQQSGPVSDVNKVHWRVYEYKDHIKNDNKGAWSEFLAYIDTIPGELTDKRRLIVEIANRITGENFKIGMKLLIPDRFPSDFRAYTPYPLHYAAAEKMPKLFVIDKYTQTFGAYEHGDLVRWGLVCTGRENDLTPAGRYNFNWKTEYRQSSEAPEGQVWEMYWVFNLDARSGIHVHQYALPISKPSSHGCVRMASADAQWNYNWANGWLQQNGRLVRNGTPVIIVNDNPASGRANQWDITGDEAISMINLPDNPMDIRPGTEEQKLVAWNSGW